MGTTQHTALQKVLACGLAIGCIVLLGGAMHGGLKRCNEAWLRDATTMTDGPHWDRYVAIAAGLSMRWFLSDDQRRTAGAARDAALEQALVAREFAALVYVRHHRPELARQHPLNPTQHGQRRRALELLWPDLDERFGVELVYELAERCRLHQVQEPVEPEAVVACLRAAATWPNGRLFLERWIEQADMRSSTVAGVDRR